MALGLTTGPVIFIMRVWLSPSDASRSLRLIMDGKSNDLVYSVRNTAGRHTGLYSSTTPRTDVHYTRTLCGQHYGRNMLRKYI
jgi:hypothetical protein